MSLCDLKEQHESDWSLNTMWKSWPAPIKMAYPIPPSSTHPPISFWGFQAWKIFISGLLSPFALYISDCPPGEYDSVYNSD